MADKFYFNIYFGSYSIVLILYMMNMFVAVLNDCHTVCVKAHKQDPLDIYMYMKTKLYLFMGFGDPRAPPTREEAIFVCQRMVNDLDHKVCLLTASMVKGDWAPHDCVQVRYNTVGLVSLSCK